MLSHYVRIPLGSDPTPEHVLKSFTSFAGKYDEILIKIKEQQVEVDRWLAAIDVDSNRDLSSSLQTLSFHEENRFVELRQLLYDLKGPVARVELQINDIHALSSTIIQTGVQVNQLSDALASHHRSAVMDWLSKEPHHAYHQAQIKKVLAGTGQWLLRDSAYLDWQRSSSSSLLWLHGSMGSGKSCLTSVIHSMLLCMTDANQSAIVVNQLLQRHSVGIDPRPHYYYCMRDPLQKTRADHTYILGSIARQMCCTDAHGVLLPAAIEMYTRCNEQASAMPTSEESVDLIIRMTEARPVTYIVLDALDECDQETRGELLLALQKIVDRASALVKVFVSSRDDADIVAHFSIRPHIRVEIAKTQDDIQLFIEKRVDESAQRAILRGKATINLILEIKEALKAGAGGM